VKSEFHATGGTGYNGIVLVLIINLDLEFTDRTEGPDRDDLSEEREKHLVEDTGITLVFLESLTNPTLYCSCFTYIPCKYRPSRPCIFVDDFFVNGRKFFKGVITRVFLDALFVGVTQPQTDDIQIEEFCTK